MIVLDTSCLSAFVRLDVLDCIHSLHSDILISTQVRDEYSVKWRDELPSWIQVHRVSTPGAAIQGLSDADLSSVDLARK